MTAHSQAVEAATRELMGHIEANCLITQGAQPMLEWLIVNLIQAAGAELTGAQPASDADVKDVFTTWAQTYYRNAATYTQRDFDIGLSAWKAATNSAQPVQPAPVPVAVCDPYEKAKDGVYGPEYESQFSAQPVQPAPAEQGDAKDAERYRWLAPRLRVRKMQPVSGAVRDGIEVKLGCSFIDSNIKKEIETFKLDAAIDAAILAKPGGTET